MKLPVKKSPLKFLLFLVAVYMILATVFAEDAGKKPSRYSPVVKEDFASTMVRMQAEKPEVENKADGTAK